MTGMFPKDVIESKEVPLVNREIYPPEDTLPEDGLYHYLLQSREEHNDRHKRATDRICLRPLTDCQRSWKTLVIR